VGALWPSSKNTAAPRERSEMIWFGNLTAHTQGSTHVLAVGDDASRMEHALRWVAARAPNLSGGALVDALAETGLVDHATAARLLPTFRGFDADRVFAESLRALSLKGLTASEEFRSRIGLVVDDVAGGARLETVGPEAGIRFGRGDRQGVLLAYPQVQFTLGGAAAQAVSAAVAEMPDALVIVARNFADGTAGQLSSLLERTGIPGTLVTVNLLLGMRAIALKYQPTEERVFGVLGAGRALRSRDIAALGSR
jgi:hypothetical protein